MIHIDGSTHLYEKLLDFAPQVMEKIQQMLGGNQSSATTTPCSTHQQNPYQPNRYDQPPM